MSNCSNFVITRKVNYNLFKEIIDYFIIIFYLHK